MRAVFLYGPPGVGKLTIGQALAGLTGFKLVHNQLSVNLVSAVFPFSSEPWTRLLRRVRREVFDAASSEGVDLIVTGVYNGTAEVANAWHTMLEAIEVAGGTVLWVRLTCDIPELMNRVQEPSRSPYGKLTDPQVLVDRLAREDLFPTIPFQPHVSIDVTSTQPEDVARHIVEHYRLPDVRVDEDI